ncbi:hypothetical protein ACMXYV_14465 [Neptuniibacter sp. SY11_33]|uniref:hypothetical protein n=1 Tax=Neptuniibacter sp. SY11_33 TaxID=3398215 RepID=UPI0039F4B615
MLGIIITIPELYFDFRDGELYVWYFYVSLGLSVIYGVISIMLGQKMMKSPQGGTKYADSVGMWLAISGFLMATIILAAFNVLTYIALDIYLAMMFFSHTKISLENNNESSPETA